MGRTLRVIMDGMYADFELPADAVGDELRKNPQLLGAVMRLNRSVPPSEDGKYIGHRP